VWFVSRERPVSRIGVVFLMILAVGMRLIASLGLGTEHYTVSILLGFYPMDALSRDDVDCFSADQFLFDTSVSPSVFHDGINDEHVVIGLLAEYTLHVAPSQNSTVKHNPMNHWVWHSNVMMDVF